MVLWYRFLYLFKQYQWLGMFCFSKSSNQLMFVIWIFLSLQNHLASKCRCWLLFTVNFFSGTFWGAIADDIAAVGPPTGFQGKLLSFLDNSILWLQHSVSIITFDIFHRLHLIALPTSSCCWNVLQCPGNFELYLRTLLISFFAIVGDSSFLLELYFRGSIYTLEQLYSQ